MSEIFGKSKDADRKMTKRVIENAGYSDYEKMARGGENWIEGAIKHPGALHKELHVPQGEKIPAKKLEQASHSENPTLRSRANMAKTLKKFK